MRNILIALLAVVIAPIVALAQPLADKVPADAIVYVGWTGSESMGPGLAGSHLKAVLDSSNLGEFFDTFLPAALAKLGQNDPQAGQKLRLLSAIGGPMWRHPSAFYFGGVDFSNPQMPMPRAALLCDAGKDAAALKNELTNLVQQMPAPLQVSENGGLVVVSIGKNPALDALLNPAGRANARPKPLMAADGFTEAMGKLQKEPAFAAYVDAESLLSLADQAVNAGPDASAKENWPKLRDALSLSGIKRIGVTSGFDGKDWGSEAFISAPAPRKGLLAMLEAQPLSEQALAMVPKTASTASVGCFDASKLLPAIRQTAGNFDPKAQGQIDQFLEQLHQNVGVDVQKDLLEAFGDEWACYTDANVGGENLLGAVLINQPKDAAKLQKAMVQIEEFATRQINQQLGRQHMSINVRETKVGDLTIRYWALPAVAPAWAIKDGKLIVALYPQVVAAAADHLAAKGEGLAANPAFQAVRKRLGDQKASSIQFADLPRTVDNSYTTWLLLTHYAGMGDLFGIPSPPMILPPLNKLKAELAPSGAVAWSDDAGFHFKTITPFPGADLVAGDPISNVVKFEAPLLVSILLPSLNRARETANRVKCASNLRQIGQGMMLYANENKGKYPADLGTLIINEDMGPQVFVCPSSNNSVPADFGKLKPEDQKKWVNEHSSYIYLGTGKNNSAGADEVLCYEKPDNHGHDGINMLFGDGHVEFVPQRNVERFIKKDAEPKNGKL